MNLPGGLTFCPFYESAYDSLNEITVIDHAFTQPWTVTKHYQRIPNDRWYEDNCAENNDHIIIIGEENYFMSGDGYLMPAREDQAPPDPRYFKPTRR
jgi:hypothetical protein